jgi:hypothetical protein
VPLSQVCGEGKRFADVRLFDIWKIGQQLFDGAARGHRLDDHAGGHTHAPDAWLAAHDRGIHGNAVEVLYVVWDSAEATLSAGRWVAGTAPKAELQEARALAVGDRRM